MENVRVGVIGVGNIGMMHADNIYNGKIHGMELTAVCDLRTEQIKLCREKYANVTFYKNYQELIHDKQVDAVVIATPHRQYAEIAIEALRTDLHVLVEKPIDVTVTKALELCEVAKQSQKKFAIMFNQRTNPLFQKAREIVKSGALGELKRFVWIITNWYRTQAYYDSGNWRATWSGEAGGVLINQAPHNLDLWQWICGMPQSLHAYCNVAKYHNIEVEDDVTIYAEYKNGATGVFITSTGEYPGTNRLEISGDRGKIVIENSVLKWWKTSEKEREFCYTSKECSPNVACEYQEFPFEGRETGHNGILQNFADAILHGEELVSPGTDGICELTLSNAAYLSEWTGNKKIQLPFDNAKFDELLTKRSETSVCKKVKEGNSEPREQTRWQVRW
ncbi:MAG: Gfo/Idh/MocA family oxidoreductase [Lachnospiraceae bacterium]|nr:Gfo/Idh/MocA family oxidoreductase [Lachnospiraceae bacterium]